MNGKGKVVCGAKKRVGFKYQCKPKALLCRKTFPTGCKEDHLQKDFASTPPQWCAGMATRTKCPILHAPQHASVHQSLYIITLTHVHGGSKQHSIAILLDMSAKK